MVKQYYCQPYLDENDVGFPELTFTADELVEQEPILSFTGLYDKWGRPIMAKEIKNPIGFKLG